MEGQGIPPPGAPGGAPGCILADMDFHRSVSAEKQTRAVGVIHSNANRDALHHFGEVGAGVSLAQKREGGQAGITDINHPAGQFDVRRAVQSNVRRLPHLQPLDVALFKVSGNIKLIRLDHHGHRLTGSADFAGPGQLADHQSADRGFYQRIIQIGALGQRGVVHPGQHLAGLNGIALLHIHANDLPGDLRADFVYFAVHFSVVSGDKVGVVVPVVAANAGQGENHYD